jgi:sugar phosphate isomerase/epimerase
MDVLGAECIEAAIVEDLSLPDISRGPVKYEGATPAGIRRLSADLKASGKRISALCMANRFDERPEKELAWCVEVCRVAKEVGAPAVRIDVWPRKLEGDAFLKLAADVLKRILEKSEESGVALAIENHGKTTNDPEFLSALFERVGSARLGLTLDTGNFYWFGHPLSKVEEIFATFAPRVRHTHCKGIHYPESEREKRRPMGWEYDKYNCALDEGDVDYPRLVKVLRAAGYANDLCVENESLGKVPEPERAKVVAREIRYLKSLT